jgi:putative hydrolase of the HAD superfamily
MVYDGVLFDFFGTLTTAVQRGREHVRIAQSLGCDPADWFRVLDRTFYDRAVGANGTPYKVLDDLARMAGGRPNKWSVRCALADRIHAIRADAPLRPDAVSTLTRLRRAGVRTAVVSDCWYELPVFLQWLPVADLLDAKIYSYAIGRSKPHPDIYLAACDRLGVAPERCLFVGDGGSQELTGAERVGITAIRLRAPDLVGHLVYNADAAWTGPAITSLSEVVALAGAYEHVAV